MKTNNLFLLVMAKQKLRVSFQVELIKILSIFHKLAFKNNLIKLTIFCMKNYYCKEKLYKNS
jgi:hypothetical protein